MRILLSGIALAALAVTTAHADPGGGHGGGNGGGKGNGNGNGAMAMGNPGHGNGNGHGNGGEGRGNGPQMEMRGNGNGNGKGADRGRGNDDRPAIVQRADNRSDRGKGRDDVRAENRDQGRFESRDAVRVVQQLGNDDRRPDWRSFDQRGVITGCPPGLAKKNNGCMPPGLAKQAVAVSYPTNWWGLRGLRDVSGYRYYDGNLVRYSSGGAITDYYPLLGGALSIGNPWPTGWQPTPLNPYYANYYGLGDNYRYFDGAIYNVDPTTSAIQSIAALLTGDTFNVGQRLPVGYDVYNVPYQYRSQYADGPDGYYRYSDGYVYQVDPKTQLIMAAIKLLT